MRGFAFPMRFGPLGHLARVEGAALYRARLQALALRRMGESPLREKVGVGISNHLFANVSPALLVLMGSQIREAIVRYEPGVRLAGIRVEPTDAENTLRIRIAFVVRDTGQEDSFSFNAEL